MAAGAEPRGRARRRGLPALALVALLACAAARPGAADVISLSGNLVLGVSSGNVCNLTAAGLGIGTTTPSANLHVAGNTVVSGALVAGGTSNTSGSNLHIGGTLGFSVQTVSSNTTLSGNSVILVDTSSANVTVTLPSASTAAGRLYTIKKTASTGTMTLGANTSPIDNAFSYAFTTGSNALPYVSVVSNGSQWLLLEQSGTATSTTLSSNLVGWWKLDETSGTTVYDSAGSNNGTVSETIASGNSVAGHSGNALVFNGNHPGTNVNLGTGAGDLLEQGAFTIALWYKITGTLNTNDGLISKDQSGPYAFSLRFDGGVLTSLFNGGAMYASGGTTQNTWYHVAVTFTSAAVEAIYLDGVLKNSASATQPASNGDTLYLGLDYQTGQNRHPPCVIDEVRIYNRALSADEVRQLAAY